MSLSSSALTRSRSTRKPSGKPERDEDTQRNVSPSRLPVKGAASLAASSTDRSSRSVSGASGTKGNTSRPLSGVFGRLRQVATGPTQDASPSMVTSRPPRTTRPPVTRPTSSSGPPVTSTSRPTTSSGVPSSAAAPQRRVPSGHSRTKSSVTTLSGATILRPPSQGSTGSSSASGTTTTTAHGQTDRSRPPIAANTRAATAAHRRQASGTSTSSSTTTTITTTLAPRRATREQPPAQQQAQQSSAGAVTTRLRPAFTTLQQHYSPAKSLAPKPLTATFLAPPSPSKLPANVAISAETARLQTELLQLHLMHRDAATVQAKWRESARQKLGRRFAQLVEREREITKARAEAVERINVRALLDWGEKSKGLGLEQQVQVLDGILCGLWALGEPAGRYVRVVRKFEKWIERAEQVWGVRRAGDLSALSGEGADDLSAVLIGELDSQWKDECAGLARRLDEWKKSLKELDTPQADGPSDESSLAKILGACRALVHDMLAELDLMEKMERDVVLEEMRWVRAVNREMDGGKHEKDRCVTRAGAIWRAF